MRLYTCGCTLSLRPSCTSIFQQLVINSESWEWLSLNKRSYDVLLARLRSGCTDLNDHLYKTKLEPSPLCKFCKTETESVEHYIFHCTKYDNHRKVLFDELAKLNIDQTKTNLQLLLTGGVGLKKDRLNILRIFMNYVKLTERFDIQLKPVNNILPLLFSFSETLMNAATRLLCTLARFFLIV